jgi:hypothetical protein
MTGFLFGRLCLTENGPERERYRTVGAAQAMNRTDIEKESGRQA